MVDFMVAVIGSFGESELWGTVNAILEDRFMLTLFGLMACQSDDEPSSADRT